MVIDKSGSVGIGSATSGFPLATLDVAGNIRGSSLALEYTVNGPDYTFLSMKYDSGTVNITPRQMSYLTAVTSALATQDFVTGKNYLTALPSTADFLPSQPNPWRRRTLSLERTTSQHHHYQLPLPPLRSVKRICNRC